MPVNPEVTDKPDPLYEAINAAAKEAFEFVALARDPFKAPEQVIEAIMPLLKALWIVQVEYAAAMRMSRV